ncbi:iron donor protein CyaY [Paramagnetospirillum kuznetsovii]|uniref:Iron donor protein CyaY n=1 Tax=Paramagnetospirillum kuznetsovii TaxID=2053833 RepID=A0A364NWM5_9PROT|nr:iron donor protein CyaY [Paramagnetospirillum kuznetsovii]RAU21456.1 iron donor protein CyaY [Paramagnetospirillum kuznetsovii]
MSLDESRFVSLADQLIEHIADAVEDALDKADADIQSGILTITLPGVGQWVINKHTPNREIWVSSPKSGAYHFAHNDGGWVSTRDASVAMVPLLAAELGVEL